jgi:hypothetical protein
MVVVNVLNVVRTRQLGFVRVLYSRMSQEVRGYCQFAVSASKI